MQVFRLATKIDRPTFKIVFEGQDKSNFIRWMHRQETPFSVHIGSTKYNFLTESHVEFWLSGFKLCWRRIDREISNEF